MWTEQLAMVFLSVVTALVAYGLGWSLGFRKASVIMKKSHDEYHESVMKMISDQKD